MTAPHKTDTTADPTVSRRSVLTTAAGLVVGSTALAGLGPQRAAAVKASGTSFQLRERNEDYIAVKVRFPSDVYDEIEFPSDVYLGDADQFVVHDDEDAVSLPEKTDQLATPVKWERLEERTYLMYFRTVDVDWPKSYDGVKVTLAGGAFPERTVSDDKWDTCPGLYINVRDLSEDYIVVEGRLPDDLEADDIAFLQDTYLGHAEDFVIHEEEDAVSLPDDTDGLAKPVEIDYNNPRDWTMYFRTDDVDLSEADGEDVMLGLGLFPERTVPGDRWDSSRTW